MLSVSLSDLCSAFDTYAEKAAYQQQPLRIENNGISLIAISPAEYNRLLEASQSISQKAEQPKPTIYTPDTLKPILIPICQKYDIRRMSVFGSVARGEATEKSDVDLLFDCPKSWSYISLIGFHQVLEEALGCKVDFVTEGIDDKKFLERIKKDEVVIYER